MFGLAELYALNISVTCLTDNEEKYNKFLNLINSEKYGSDDQAYLFNDWKNINNFLKDNNMPKFDIIIGNPPYGASHTTGISKTLHFDITQTLKESYIDKMIMLMPNTIAYSTSTLYDKFKCCFDNELCEITNEQNPFTSVQTNVGIFTFVKNNQHKIKTPIQEISSLFDITPFTNYELSYTRQLKNDYFAKKFYVPYPNSSKIKKYCRLVSIANGGKNAQWFSARIKDCPIFDATALDEWNATHHAGYASISSDNKLELENITAAMNRPLLRFCLYRTQNAQAMKRSVYKYIPDIDWSDERTKTDEGILEIVGFSKEQAIEFAKYTKKIIDEVDSK